MKNVFFFLFSLCQPSSSVSLFAFKKTGFHDPPLLRSFQIKNHCSVSFRDDSYGAASRAGHCAPADGSRVPGIVRRGVGFVSCVVDRTAEWTVTARRPLESLHCVEGMLIAGTAAAQSGITLVTVLVPGTVEQSIPVLIK